MENPSERSFFGVLKTVFQSKTANLLILLLIVAAVPLTVFVAGQRQKTRQSAQVKVQQQSNSEIAYSNPQTTTKAVLPASTSQNVCACELKYWNWPPLVHRWTDKGGGGCSSMGLLNDSPCDGYDNSNCVNYRTQCPRVGLSCVKPDGSVCGNKCANTNKGASCDLKQNSDGSITVGECNENKQCVAVSRSQPPSSSSCQGKNNGDSCDGGLCYDVSGGEIRCIQGAECTPQTQSRDCSSRTCDAGSLKCISQPAPSNPCQGKNNGDSCDGGLCYKASDTETLCIKGAECTPQTQSRDCPQSGTCDAGSLKCNTNPDGGGTAPNPNPPPAGQQPGDRVNCEGCKKDENEFPQCGGTLHNKPCSASTTEVDQHNLIMVQKWDCVNDGERWSTTDTGSNSQCGGIGGEPPSPAPPAPPPLSGENDLKPQCGPYPNNKLFAKWNISGSNCNVYIRGGTTDTTINDGGACSGQKTIEQLRDGRITNDGIYSLFVSNGSQTIEKGPERLNCQAAPTAPPASCNPDAVSMTVAPADSTKTEIKVGDTIKFNVSGSQGSTWISEQGLSDFTDCTGGIWGNKICKALKEGQDITWTHNWKNCAGSAANCPVTCAKNAKFTIKSSASAIPACDKSKVTMSARSIDDPASPDIFVNDNIKFNVSGEQGSTHPQDQIDQNPTGIIDYTNGGYFGTSNFKAQKTGVITWVHKWKNCAGTTSNCSDTVCSSDPVLVSVKPAPNFRVEGVIFNDTDGNQEQGAGEAGVSGIIVKLTNEDKNTSFTAGATDASGRFVFESIPRGNRYKGEITNIPANNYVTVNYPVRTAVRANVTGFKIGIRQNPVSAKEIKGKLNTVDCNVGITGYACIPSETSTQLNVDIFDYSGAKLGTVKADQQNSTSECQGNHKFVFDVPSLLKDGNPHSIYAHAINIINGQNPELTGSPQTFTCANPAELDGEEGINIGDFNVLLSKYKSKENINYCTTSRSNICSYPNKDGFIDLRSFGLWFIDAYPFLH